MIAVLLAFQGLEINQFSFEETRVTVAPGMVFSRKVSSNPPLVITGLQVDPKKFTAKSWLAGGSIYEPNASKGRGTVTSMERESGAVAAINGDFFQWGADPGGDPDGFMISNGELLSQPNSKMAGSGVGWGTGIPFRLVNGKWNGSVKLPSGKSLPINQLNGRADSDQLAFSMSRAGSIYASEAATAQSPATLLKLTLSELGKRATANGTINATVKQIGKLSGVQTIPAGEAVLVATGKADQLGELKVGDKLEVTLGVDADIKGITEVMGGGPMLLKKGVFPGANKKSDLAEARHPRSAMGQTADGKIWYVLIDGRQEMSQGTTMKETSDVMKLYGCVDAMNLDGGGSSALNLLGMTLNRPSGGIQRLVANGVMVMGNLPKGGPSEAFRYEFSVPKTLSKGSTYPLVLKTKDGKSVPAEKVIFSCQGACWVDGGNRLHASSEGIADLYALVGGVVVHQTLKVQ